jgi:omega-6 fatty acid desaturase (delta-12 desaturase)
LPSGRFDIVRVSPEQASDMAGQLAEHELRSDWRACSQVLTTAGPFVALWIAAWASLEVSYLLTLLLAIPTGGFLVRFFVLQHDCGHRSLFRSPLANKVAGRLISVLTFAPFDQWRRNHAVHHATSGNLDRRGVGDITTLTVDEYHGLSLIRRLAYRAYRNPVLMFGLGGIYVILVKQRVPFGPRGRSRWWWVSSQMSNLAIALTISMLCWAIGLESFIKVHAPVFLVYTTIGIWLFFAEHQFQNTYWRTDAQWDFHEAGISGSSYLTLPRPLQWLTANIGIHHVHHLNPRIPNYRLQECIRARPYLAETNQLTLRDAIWATRLALWDPNRMQLVGFRDVAQTAPLSASV